MLPNHVRNGFVLGLLLLCIGFAIYIIPIPRPLQIDPGPSSRLVMANGCIFYGMLAIIFSGIFWLKHLISNYESVQKLEV
jgi:hypothetical protein